MNYKVSIYFNYFSDVDCQSWKNVKSYFYRCYLKNSGFDLNNFQTYLKKSDNFCLSIISLKIFSYQKLLCESSLMSLSGSETLSSK